MVTCTNNCDITQCHIQAVLVPLNWHLVEVFILHGVSAWVFCDASAQYMAPWTVTKVQGHTWDRCWQYCFTNKSSLFSPHISLVGCWYHHKICSINCRFTPQPAHLGGPNTVSSKRTYRPTPLSLLVQSLYSVDGHGVAFS